MKKESIQQKISRIRPPRVHITYDVEVGGAMVMKELPFVVGVMGDFTGQPAEDLPPVRDRKFVHIDRDNFDQVLFGMKPRLVLRVPNMLSEEGGSKLVELRQNLNDLLAKMDGNEKLGNILEDVMNNTEAQKQLGAALGIETSASGEEKKEE